jgi:formate hydrogenlyase subunit 3/multisubunit Na+/H+ antiporter MnhD subunit
MTLLAFLGLAFGGAAVSLLVRRREALSTAVGVAGLAGAVLAAAAIGGDASVPIGGGRLEASEYLRLFAVLGSIASLLLVLLGLVTTSHRHAPGVVLAGLGAAVLALAMPDPQAAVIAATAGGLIGILVTVTPPATSRGVVVGVRELRALAMAGALAILASAWIGRPLDELLAEPAVFGLAYLGFVVGVAIRFGAIPFHFWAARLADAAPEIALPMLMAWGPAAFGVVALSWIDQSVAPLALPLIAERGLVAAVGVASILLGSVAAWIQDDLEHVVGYTIISDAGVAILGLAVLDSTAWQPARTWILVYLVTRSAFAAWAVAVRGAFGTRRVAELGGWIRKAPLLAAALAVIVIASIGWPGFVAWEARASLIDAAIGPPLAFIVLIGALGPLAAYGRLAAVGLRPRSAAVAGGSDERPRWPSSSPTRPVVGRGSLERAFARRGEAIGRSVDLLSAVPGALQANRTPIAAVIVLAMAGLSFGVAAGGFGIAAAAAAVPQTEGPTEPTSPPGPSVPPASASPTLPPAAGSAPPATSSPDVASPTAEPSFEPVPNPS